MPDGRRFVAFTDEQGYVSEPDMHLLRHALGVRDGDDVDVVHGNQVVASRWCDESLISIGRPLTLNLPTSKTIVWPLTAGERPDWVVQKSTELGLTSLRLYVKDPTQPWWDDQRLQAIHVRASAIVRRTAMRQGIPWIADVVVEKGLRIDALDPTVAWVSNDFGADRPPPRTAATVVVLDDTAPNVSPPCERQFRVAPTRLRPETLAVASACHLAVANHNVQHGTSSSSKSP